MKYVNIYFYNEVDEWGRGRKYQQIDADDTSVVKTKPVPNEKRKPVRVFIVLVGVKSCCRLRQSFFFSNKRYERFRIFLFLIINQRKLGE